MHLSRHLKYSSSLITPCGQVMASVRRMRGRLRGQSFPGRGVRTPFHKPVEQLDGFLAKVESYAKETKRKKWKIYMMLLLSLTDEYGSIHQCISKRASRSWSQCHEATRILP